MSYKKNKYMVVRNAMPIEGANFIQDYFVNKKSVQKILEDFREKQKIEAEIAKKEKEAAEREAQRILNIQNTQRALDRSRIERAYREETGGQGGSYATGKSGVQSDGSYNDPFDPGGGE